MSNIISTDVPTDLAERIEDAREQNESRSAAVRRLIRAGLDADSGGVGSRIATTAALVLIMGYPTAAAATGNTQLAVLFIALIAVLQIVAPQIESATARIRSRL